jgi:hypothetical protein
MKITEQSEWDILDARQTMAKAKSRLDWMI